MKVTTFVLDNPEYQRINESSFQHSNAIFHLPILQAYAIHHAELKLNYSISLDEVNRHPDFVVKQDSVIIFGVDSFFSLDQLGGILTVYYAGIKEYSLLFPHIKSRSLLNRLGQFAQEAESAFESQSWMSYVLMVGAVIEGIFYNEFGNKSFFDLVTLADKNGFITSSEVELFDNVRGLRNLIHPAKHDQPFVDRKIAMELSVIYDRLLKRDWLKSEK